MRWCLFSVAEWRGVPRGPAEVWLVVRGGPDGLRDGAEYTTSNCAMSPARKVPGLQFRVAGPAPDTWPALPACCVPMPLLPPALGLCPGLKHCSLQARTAASFFPLWFSESVRCGVSWVIKKGPFAVSQGCPHAFPPGALVGNLLETRPRSCAGPAPSACVAGPGLLVMSPCARSPEGKG